MSIHVGNLRGIGRKLMAVRPDNGSLDTIIEYVDMVARDAADHIVAIEDALLRLEDAANTYLETGEQDKLRQEVRRSTEEYLEEATDE